MGGVRPSASASRFLRSLWQAILSGLRQMPIALSMRIGSLQTSQKRGFGLSWFRAAHARRLYSCTHSGRAELLQTPYLLLRFIGRLQTSQRRGSDRPASCCFLSAFACAFARLHSGLSLRVQIPVALLGRIGSRQISQRRSSDVPSFMSDLSA